MTEAKEAADSEASAPYHRSQEAPAEALLGLDSVKAVLQRTGGHKMRLLIVTPPSNSLYGMSRRSGAWPTPASTCCRATWWTPRTGCAWRGRRS